MDAGVSLSQYFGIDLAALLPRMHAGTAFPAMRRTLSRALA